MVVPDEITDARYIFRRKALRGQKVACRSRTQLLLILAIRVAILSLCRMDADVVDHGYHLCNQLCMSVNTLLTRYQLGETMHLQKMLDAHGIALVKRYHSQREPVDLAFYRFFHHHLLLLYQHGVPFRIIINKHKITKFSSFPYAIYVKSCKFAGQKEE